LDSIKDFESRAPFASIQQIHFELAHRGALAGGEGRDAVSGKAFAAESIRAQDTMMSP
jgi:hypothetical protein